MWPQVRLQRSQAPESHSVWTPVLKELLIAKLEKFEPQNKYKKSD